MQAIKAAPVPLKQRLEEDLRYIEQDLITIQPNGNLCRFSRKLKAIVFYNVPVARYYSYWESLYARNEECSERIKLALEDKFENGLTSIETMIALIENSDDSTKDKDNVLDLLTEEEDEDEE